MSSSSKEGGPSVRPTAAALIRERETRGLLWSLAARVLYVGIFVLLTGLYLLGLVRPGLAAESKGEAVATLVIQIVAFGFILFFTHHARRGAHLTMVGVGAAVLDVILISMLPLIWYLNLQSPDGTVSFLAKNELFTVCVIVIVINALALRPLYPVIVAGGFILVHLLLLAIVLRQPGVSFTDTYMEHFYTPAVNPGITVVRVIVLALVGFFLAFLASTARKTIHDAVALEIANMEIKEQQAELLFEGKMAALTDLVAGVAHEVNTPLGVVRSSLQASEKAIHRLREGEDPERALATAEASGRAAVAGLERISRLVSSLKDFARLDQAELQLADIRDGIETVLSLVEPSKLGEVEIERSFAAIPRILCRPKELNQVFMTLIVNALEAMDGRGTLGLSTALDRDRVRVTVSDTGPGIDEDRIDRLFELKFAPKGGRMSFGLGLPTARRIIERHGGTLTVASIVGEGSRFVISIPNRV